MKRDLCTARRYLKSPNVKTRARALKLIRELKRGRR
ncbi:MAG: putative metal homeostasis protein [Lactobacillus sp.]|nr:putative metal homeostasis protein [Lactobacillus sp.]MDN6042749.1 putative metal homeostasis protein [Lactobacillus sp.]MDN6052777.1 putative metal homeostasis protein [Lactobacillus sp.]